LLAPSRIAGRVIPDFQTVPGSEVVAVGSRDLARAQAFASKHGIPRAYGSYEALVDDPAVDVVYVTSPHVGHYEHAKLALEHGKGVLVEKPFTINAAQAADLVALARQRGLFLMEAMWTRCHPNMLELARLVRAGAIGHVRAISASLGPIGLQAGFRVFDPNLGGGALLECGVYPLSVAYHMIPMLGEPAEVSAWSTFTDAGVDDATTAVLTYPEGVVVSLATTLVAGVSSGLPSRAFVSGTSGWIDIPRNIHDPREAVVHQAGQEPLRLATEPIGNGYTYEGAEVVSAIREGRTESALVPLDDTLLLMRVLDRIRAAVGLVYPFE
jgi:predicted dehydrogenase